MGSTPCPVMMRPVHETRDMMRDMEISRSAVYDLEKLRIPFLALLWRAFDWCVYSYFIIGRRRIVSEKRMLILFCVHRPLCISRLVSLV